MRVRRLAALVAAGSIALFGLSAAAPATDPGGGAVVPAIERADAAGGGNVNQLGNRAASLLRTILGPIVIALVGVVGVTAFFKREIGLAVTAGLIALFLGLFLFAPQTAKHMIETFWRDLT